MNSSDRAPLLSVPPSLWELEYLWTVVALKVTENIVVYLPNFFRISHFHILYAKSTKWQEGCIYVQHSWENGSFKIVQLRLKVKFLPSILNLRLFLSLNTIACILPSINLNNTCSSNQMASNHISMLIYCNQWLLPTLADLVGVLWVILLSTVLWQPTSMAQLPAKLKLLWRVSLPLS